MHGLINWAVQTFFWSTYGRARWTKVMRAAELDFDEFEAMLVYDDTASRRMLTAACAESGRDPGDFLEDLGTFLVSDPQFEGLRRLLRFVGVTYVDFLHSLADLPDRTRLAVEDLTLPSMELREHSAGFFTLTCGPGLPGFSSFMIGVLRAMADDYGALVMLDHYGRHNGCDAISVALVESSFSEGRRFHLGRRSG